MLRKTVIVIICMAFVLTGMVFPGIIAAENQAKILVLPFEIHSQKDLSYLGKKIPEIISSQLTKDGGLILESDISDVKGLSVSAIRKAGVAAGADFVVWGSLSRVGNKISLDTRLLQTSGNEEPSYIAAEGDDIENLLSTVNTVSMSIGIKAFKLETISEIVVRGNSRIEAAAILRAVKTKPGDRFHKARLSEDMKTIYSMGYFDDIRIEADREGIKAGEGTRVVITVKEKPTIRKIKIKGNSAFDSEKITKEITITPGSILNSYKIKTNIRQIESLYLEKHYHHTKVTYKTYPLENNQADLEFIIEEGEKVMIKEIVFNGNHYFDDKKLKKMIQTSEKGFFSWLTSSGVLDMADLNTDVAIIGGSYQKEGFIDVIVAEPKVEYKGKWIYITFKINEGLQYKTGKVSIAGDVDDSKEDLMKKLKISDEEFCNKEIIQNDVIALTDVYADKGYAAANVNPVLKRNPSTLTADIEYSVNKGKLVYFERIVIGGNTVTRDKVIRRQLQVYEEELYSSSKLKRSVRNLYRMDYFEDVQVDTVRGTRDDTMNLIVNVKEKPTGTFTFGMGYSSEDKLFGTVAVAKRNLFGRDQTLNLQGEFGQTTQKYSVNFTEPWLFDIPLSARGEIMDWSREYDGYDKRTIGAGVKFGYPIYDYTRLYIGYSHEINDVTITDSTEVDPETVLEGEYKSRSVTTTVQYDSRDRAYNAQATEGSDCSATVKYAGGPFGGDLAFSKYRLTAGRYFPLLAKFIGFLHAEGGYARESSDGYLPDWEKFYLGGMNSIRGFDWHDIGVKKQMTDSNGDPAEDEDGNPIYGTYGGEKYIQFNVELLRPIVTDGLLGLVFFDAGNVYSKDEHIDPSEIRQSYGFGIRWYSPIGPIRFERGYIIDPQPGEPRNGKWDFTMGGTF